MPVCLSVETIIPLKYGVAKNEPLIIKVIYDNQGNVYIEPDLHLKIIQVSTGNVIHNAIYPYPENENPVKPFERKEFPNLIEWQTAGQERGMYRAEIKVLLKGREYQKTDFRFRLGRKSFSELLLGWISKISNNSLFNWFSIGLFFIILAGVFTLISKKRNNQRVEGSSKIWSKWR